MNKKQVKAAIAELVANGWRLVRTQKHGVNAPYAPGA
jgi:hypothetical protein